MSSPKYTVLVVEDEALIRFAIVDELVMDGFDVFEARGADEAISIIEQHSNIRVIFTDIDMPGTMDGLKLAQFVRDRWPPIKIIVTSGRFAPHSDELPPNAHFFPKPYEYKVVIAAMKRLVEMY